MVAAFADQRLGLVSAVKGWKTPLVMWGHSLVFAHIQPALVAVEDSPCVVLLEGRHLVDTKMKLHKVPAD